MNNIPQEIIFWQGNNQIIISLYDLKPLNKKEMGILEIVFSKEFSKLSIDGVKILIFVHSINRVVDSYTISVDMGAISNLGLVPVVSKAPFFVLRDILRSMANQMFEMFFGGGSGDDCDDYKSDDETPKPLPNEQFDFDRLMREMKDEEDKGQSD
jgi:hypothetical protein